MKRFLALFLCIISLRAADLTTVIFSTEQVVGVPLTNTLVEFRPLGLLTWSNRIVPLIPFTNRTDSSGNFTTNFIPGSYRVTIYDRRADTPFTNSFPESATPIYAADYITVGTNTVAGMAYNQATSLNLFAKRTNAIRILTNGVSAAVGYTNINFTSGVTGYLSGATLNLGVSSAGTSVDTNAFQPASTTLTNLAGTGAITNAPWTNSYQIASTILTNLSGTGALTNSAQFVASDSGSSSNLTVRSLNGVDSLALTVNTNSLVVTNGRVGIGTNAPARTLDVAGTMVAGAGSATQPSYAFNSDTNSGFYSLADDIPVLSVGGGRSWTFSSTLLGGANNATIGFYSAGFGAFDTAMYRVGANTNGFGNAVPTGSILASNAVWLGSEEVKGVLTVATNILVVTNGRVGIGTNAPSNALTISGHVDVSGNITNTGNMSAGNFFAYGTGGYTTRNTVTGNRTFLVFDGGGGSVQQQMAAAAVIKWNSTSGTIDSGTLDTWIYRHGSGTNGFGTTASTPGGSIIASNHIFTGLAHFRTNTVNTPPTAAQLGQGGFIIWSSNGSPWVSRCLDGSTVESKSIF